MLHNTSDILPKQCCVCLDWFPATHLYFPFHSNSKTQLRPRCKLCEKLIKQGLFVPIAKFPCSEGYKRCTSCLKSLPETHEHFPRNHRGKNGLLSICFECSRISNALYRANPAHAETARIRTKKYRQSNPEKVKETNRNYQQNNPDKKRAWQNKWNIANTVRLREVRRLASIRRRARKNSLPDTFTEVDYERCMAYWGEACAITGEKADLCLDHWIPLYSPDCPGTIPTNIIPMTKKLNSSKRHNDPLEWLIWKFGKEQAFQILGKIQVYFRWINDQKLE